MQAYYAVKREYFVLVAVGDKKRPRGNQCGDEGIIPLICVYEIHAVAMPFHASVDDVVLQIGDAGNGNGDFDAFVQCRYPPTVSAPTRPAGNPDAIGVDFFSGFKIIQGADAVEGFGAGGCVAATVPPPHVIPVGAVVNALDFAHLYCVDGQAYVAVAGEPRTVMLVAYLVAVTDAVDFDGAMTAEVKDRRCRFVQVFGKIEIAGHIEPGHGLEMNLLDGKLFLLNRASHNALEIGLWGHWIESKHLKELLSIDLTFILPVFQRFDIGQTPNLKFGGFCTKVFGYHAVAFARVNSRIGRPSRRKA